MTERRPGTESELVEFVRAIDVRAPEELHRRVETMIAERSQGPRGRRRRGFGTAPRLAAAGALAALATVAVAIALIAGGSSGLSLRRATALTLSPSRAPAPQEMKGKAQLTAAVGGVRFPYWEGSVGWRATGLRHDRAGGRAITTVFYGNSRGQRLGYAIVAGLPAPPTRGGKLVWRDGTAYRVSSVNGSHVVSWLRRGHLCVIAGRGISAATLLRLASWDDRDRIAT
jgi:hypothetical protein